MQIVFARRDTILRLASKRGSRYVDIIILRLQEVISDAAHDFVNIVGSHFGLATSTDGTSASTDFVSIILR